MGIPCKNLLCGAVLVAGTAIVTSTVVSQDMGSAPSQEEMMQMWMKMAQPGPEHKKLQESAGSWVQHATSWWGGPDAPPTESSSTSKIEPILGGRFMLERVKGEMNGPDGKPMSWEGMGIYGYDNAQEKYTYVWMDSMGTMMMFGEGTADETGNVITYHSEMYDPAMQTTAQMKSVATRKDKDHQTYEMFRQMPDGTWHKEFQMKMTRQ